MERTIAAGIEAIFILLGKTDLEKRQDPISFDKLEVQMVSYFNKILGVMLNTRCQDVYMPVSYVDKTIKLLKPFHRKRKSFFVKEVERVMGILIHDSCTVPWLKFFLPHTYVCFRQREH